MIKIVLADDHQVVRKGIRALLEMEPDFQIVGETGDGLEAVQLAIRLRPDVLVLDLMMPGLNGIDITPPGYQAGTSDARGGSFNVRRRRLRFGGIEEWGHRLCIEGCQHLGIDPGDTRRGCWPALPQPTTG